MNIPASLSRLKDFCHPREVIAYAVWACHRFALSTADVGDLLAERGVIVSREAVRNWVNHCGQHLRDCIRRDRPRPNDKWHMDEAVITIRGQKHWLWRAIDANGDVLDILVQTRRDARTAKRFFQRLITQFGEPRVVVTTNCAAILSRSRRWPLKQCFHKANHREQNNRYEAYADLANLEYIRKSTLMLEFFYLVV
jgi:putative transposase